MTILYLYSTANTAWIPVADAVSMAPLILKAQLLEAYGHFTMFQWGVDYALFSEEDPSSAVVDDIRLQ